MRYLIFRPYGPLASWGEAAVGGTRPTAGHPGRSAVIGILAAALGIERHDESLQAELRDAVSIAVKQSSPGALMRDYHTAQVPSVDRKAWRLTRQAELSTPKHQLHTILSSREYRCDGFWTVGIRVAAEARWSLEDLAAALQHPRFPLYLGRKSFPLAAPLAPRVVEARGIREALGIDLPPLTGLNPADECRRLGVGGEAAYAWEGDAGDLEAMETRYPSDQPLHRGRWQFAVRPENWCQTREES